MHLQARRIFYWTEKYFQECDNFWSEQHCLSTSMGVTVKTVNCYKSTPWTPHIQIFPQIMSSLCLTVFSKLGIGRFIMATETVGHWKILWGSWGMTDLSEDSACARVNIMKASKVVSKNFWSVLFTNLSSKTCKI